MLGLHRVKSILQKVTSSFQKGGTYVVAKPKNLRNLLLYISLGLQAVISNQLTPYLTKL